MTSSEAQKPFSLVLAKEKVRQAEAYAKVASEVLASTKARATSLIGWCVPLMGLTLAAVAHSQIFGLAGIPAVIGSFCTSLICAKVLYTTPFVPTELSPNMFDDLIRVNNCSDERELNEAWAAYLGEASSTNYWYAKRDQICLGIAWKCASFSAVAAATLLLVSWLFGWRWCIAP